MKSIRLLGFLITTISCCFATTNIDARDEPAVEQASRPAVIKASNHVTSSWKSLKGYDFIVNVGGDHQHSARIATHPSGAAAACYSIPAKHLSRKSVKVIKLAFSGQIYHCAPVETLAELAIGKNLTAPDNLKRKIQLSKYVSPVDGGAQTCVQNAKPLPTVVGKTITRSGANFGLYKASYGPDGEWIDDGEEELYPPPGFTDEIVEDFYSYSTILPGFGSGPQPCQACHAAFTAMLVRCVATGPFYEFCLDLALGLWIACLATCY